VRLTETDWQLPVVQAQYKGHFHPYVQAMIDGSAGKAKRRTAAA